MEYYNVGNLVNTQGIKGEVRVISITDFPEDRFKKGNTLFVDDEKTHSMTKLAIDGVRKQKNFIILHFKGYDSINDVLKFKPGVLKVSEDSIPDDELDEGEYYYHQIIGLSVVEDGKQLGTVKEILSPGANDVWVVKRDHKQDLLLPKIDSVIKSVDLETGMIDVEVPEGLDDED